MFYVLENDVEEKKTQELTGLELKNSSSTGLSIKSMIDSLNPIHMNKSLFDCPERAEMSFFHFFSTEIFNSVKNISGHSC